MRLLSMALLLVLFVSCNNNSGKPDISGIRVNAPIHRFDRDFFSMDTTSLTASLNGLYKKYPSFLPLYFEYLSPVNYIARQEGKSYTQVVLDYFRNMKPLYDSVEKKFSNLSSVQKDIEQGLRYAKYYYPGFKVPEIFTSVESLNPDNAQEIYGTTYYHDTLIISLQMFLGNDFSVYDPATYYDYIRRRFEPQYIAPNAIRAVANNLYPDSSADATLIEQMVERGKQWFLLDHLMPDAPDSLKTFYTGKQVKWVEANEGNIWKTIVQNNPDLYTVDKESIQSYIGEAPFTQDMPHEESPGNIGQWVGWQIVKKFSANNPKLNLKEILSTPARKIFQEAKYRPK